MIVGDEWPVRRPASSIRSASSSLRSAIIEYTSSFTPLLQIAFHPVRTVSWHCEKCGRKGRVEVRGESVYEAVRGVHRRRTSGTCRFSADLVFIAHKVPLST